MTVQNTGNRITYTGDGSSKVFFFPYKIISISDLVCYVNGAQTSAFTVSTPSDNGVSVTFTTAPAILASIVILRDPDLLQQSALPSSGPFPASTVEKMVDKLTLQVQRLRELVNRSFTLNDADTTTASTTLPTPKANNIVGWNAAANALQNIDPVTLATIVAFGTATPDVFVGDGSTTSFTLTANPGALGNLDVSMGGLTQTNGVDFTWSGGTTLTFTSPPPLGVKILARYLQALPQGTTDSAASTFVQSGTGAVVRVAQDKMREIEFHVKDYGASVDGVTDDTIAIQRAIWAAADAGGGTVVLGVGTSMLSATLKIQTSAGAGASYITIKGKTGKSTLKMVSGWIIAGQGDAGGQNPTAPNNRMIVTNYGSYGIRIEGVTLDGNMTGPTYKYNGYGIGLMQCYDSHVKDCTVQNLGGEGILIEAGALVRVLNTKIRNCFHGINSYLRAEGVVIHGCDVVTRGYAVYNESSKSCVVSDCPRLEGSSGVVGYASDQGNIDTFSVSGSAVYGTTTEGVKIFTYASNQVLQASVSANYIEGVQTGVTLLGSVQGKSAVLDNNIRVSCPSTVYASPGIFGKNATINGNTVSVASGLLMLGIRDDAGTCFIGRNAFVGLRDDPNSAEVSIGDINAYGGQAQIRGNASQPTGNVRFVTGNYTATDYDETIISTSATPITITTPAYSQAAKGRRLTIKKAGAGAVSVAYQSGFSSYDGITSVASQVTMLCNNKVFYQV